jgi:TolB-like protein
MNPHAPSALYEFGSFALDGEAAMLFRSGDPAILGRRAVALLRVLLEGAGSAVSKDALIEAAWPGLAVQDSNLTVQMAALRRALEHDGGARWIETLPRRGYRYVGPPVRRTDLSPSDIKGRELPIPERPSIAALPFEQSGETCWFADGMVDDIITGLSRIKWLVVIARNSSFVYRGLPVDLKQVGRDLGVRYILQGSVRRNDNRVRINVQIADSTTGMQIWANHYDGTLEDVFALQDEIALAVVGAIEPNVRRIEVERVRRKRPDSLDAYGLVLRAQPDVDCGMPDRAATALPLLMRAIALEPVYALAHGFAAMAHHNLFLRAGLKEEHRVASVRHAYLALEYGRDDALALTFAGFSLGMDAHDRAAAMAAFETAITLSPSTALGFILGSVVHSWAGAAEPAIAWSKRGLRLSPFDSWAFAAFGSQAIGHFLQGQPEQAAKAAYQAIRSNPAHSINYVILIGPFVALGNLEEARAAAARVLELQPTFRFSRQFAGVGCAPSLASKLGDGLSAAGLPE